jgi:enediyne biosynthesis protein E4
VPSSPPWWRAARLVVLALALGGCSDGAGERTSAEATAERGGDGAASPPAAQLLVEATGAWGVDFVHDPGAAGELRFPEMMGGGVAVFDADGDGDLDLYFVNGAPEPGSAVAGPSPVNRLFLQGADGRFADATEGSGLGDPGYGTGVAIGDFDNDGWDDVFVSNVGQDRLFRSRGDGTFTDVTAAAGVGDPAWSAGAAFADVDGDGHLDLYVANYVDFTVEDHEFCGDRSRGIRGYCTPVVYRPVADRFYRNRGDGTFRDATAAAGFAGPLGAGLGVLFADFTGDGRPDVYVANDLTPNFLFLNRGDGTFVDESLLSGAAYSDTGKAEAGMGVDAADVDGDGRLDLVVTNFELETNGLYLNQGSGLFLDGRYASGLAEPSLLRLAFGVAFGDFDHDGLEDLAVANGHVLDNPGQMAAQTPYRQPNQLFVQGPRGRFREARGSGFDEISRASRGLALGDLDGDGDLDLVLTNIAGPARLYRGEPPAGHWLLVDAVDPALGGRRALGARVRVEIGGRSWVRTVQGAMSYLSSSDPRAHFVFGPRGSLTSATARVEVRWPDGSAESESFGEVAIDRVVVLRRGEGEE